MHRNSRILLGLAALCALCLSGFGTDSAWAKPKIERKSRECCDLSKIPGVVWGGHDSIMTMQHLAELCGPIIWFSPDEPLLTRERGKAIRLTQNLPFEPAPESPVLYYRINDVAVRLNAEGEAISDRDQSKADLKIDLSKVNGVDVRYCFYYPSEVGLGGHQHDLEVVDLKVMVLRWNDWVTDPCDKCRYVIAVRKVIGRAHGLQWYDNHLMVDEYTEFPIGIMVEEGKHANCPDKNLDGMFTPGFDVNQRVNDAWGVRDIIRGGALFTGGFQSWMNKVRREEDRVFPPLPEDSYVKQFFITDGQYAKDNAIYELRPLPPKELAGDDHKLEHYIESKGDYNWPYEHPDTEIGKMGGWFKDEKFAKSLSIAYRYDGNSGLAFSFPFFIIKHLEDPMGGGWILHRMYFKDKNLRDFAWTLLYAPSASRWIDGYMAAGVEWDDIEYPDGYGGVRTQTDNNFVLESGLKFRVNMRYSPIKFVTHITDFWGLRIGLKYAGNAWDFRHLGLAFEVGAGTF